MTDLYYVFKFMQYNKSRAFVILKGHICVGNFLLNSNIYITMHFFYPTQLHTYFVSIQLEMPLTSYLRILSFNIGLSMHVACLEITMYYIPTLIQHGILGILNCL